MPELPDVEGFRQVLESCAKGRVVRHVEVRDAGVLHGVGVRGLRDALEGRRFGTPERHGKWLLARTGGPTLVLHFGMTGRLVCGHADDPVEAHDRVLFTLGGGRQLRFRDQRKLQGLWLAHDESVLAGLGNLLADEILWRARLRPDRGVRDLTGEDRRRLYGEMRRTLRSSVTAGCVPPRDSWLTGHRDDRDPRCPRCDSGLRRSRMAGRGTVWCPRCQPGR
jgi:formamidopyrimidine-DNA glycosylase